MYSTHAVGASLGFVYVRESHKSYSNNGTCTAGQIHAIYSLSDGRVAIILAQDADDKCGERDAGPGKLVLPQPHEHRKPTRKRTLRLF
jgi:hypothetical protein